MSRLLTENNEVILNEDSSQVLIEIAHITIEPFTPIDSTSSVFNAEITSLFIPSVDAYFEYREVGSSSWLSTPTVSYSSPQSISVTVTGLVPEASYEYRLVVEGTYTTEVSDEEGFVVEPFSVVSDVLSISDVGVDSGLVRVNFVSANASPVSVGFRYKPSSSSTWSETTLKPAVLGENSEELSGLSGVDYDVQAFFEFGSDRVFERALTFPVGNPKRMFDNGVKRFDVGYDESQKELLYEEVF